MLNVHVLGTPDWSGALKQKKQQNLQKQIHSYFKKQINISASKGNNWMPNKLKRNWEITYKQKQNESKN